MFKKKIGIWLLVLLNLLFLAEYNGTYGKIDLWELSFAIHWDALKFFLGVGGGLSILALIYWLIFKVFGK